jgi:hypothetical protein
VAQPVAISTWDAVLILVTSFEVIWLGEDQHLCECDRAYMSNDKINRPNLKNYSSPQVADTKDALGVGGLW